MHRARRRIRAEAVTLFEGLGCPMPMKLAVLGARGLLGGAVARRARLAGHQVRAVVRPGRDSPAFPMGIEVVAGDLSSQASVLEAVRGMEVVVHAATVPYPEWPRFVPLFADNALAAAEAAGATLVFPGNVYVYGRPRSRFVAEDHPQEPHTVKGRIRLAVERKFLQAHQDGRVDLVLPRYPDVYGPGAMHADFRPVFEGALANKPCRWPLNADALPGPRAIVSRDFIRLVYAAAGSGEPIVRVFGRGMYRLVGLFSPLARAAYEMAYLFDDPILLDGTLYRSLTRGPHPSTPYEVGVPRTLEWFRTHRAIA